MVLFNYSTKELTAKVVYYGPGLCGKTTNLQWIHEKVPIKNKGKMLSLATETDRTLFFDFLPIELGTIRGMRTRIQLYTVPGQVFYNATRRMVLKGADCVVFCCDSQEPMLEANVESFENMRQNLEANEIDPEEIPLVFQYNKRDLPNALPIEILNERMNPKSLPFYEAVAVRGVGVEETLKGVTTMVFRSLAGKYGGQETTPAPAPESTPAKPPVARPMGATATLPPVTGSRPAKAAPTPAAAAPPPLPSLEEDLLDELDFGPPPAPAQAAPVAAPPAPSAPLRVVPPEKPLALEEEDIPLVMEEAELDLSRAEVGDSPLDPPRPPPRKPPPPVPDRDTLVSPPDEAEEIRRQIRPVVVPEIGLDEIEEEDEEEIEEISLDPSPPWGARDESFDVDLTPPPANASSRPSSAPARAAAPPAPSAKVAPVSVDLRRGPTEVSIPLDVVLENGSGPVRLDLRLTLNVKSSS
jgi:signal recognition particle receptor subunit beta